MSLTIQDYLTPVTQKFYGGGVNTDTTSQLWTEFSSTLSDSQKDYLTLTSSQSRDDIVSAISDLVQQTMQDEGLTLNDQDLQGLINTISVLTLKGQDAQGLISIDPSVIEKAFNQIWTHLAFSPAQKNVVACVAESVGEIGASIPAQYLSFLANKTQSEQVSEAANALSPHEQEVRRIMFEVFSLALKMVGVLQKTNQLEANLLNYYTNVQQDYISMMQKILMYGPNPQMFIMANSTDFGKTQLGYGNITVAAVANYLYSQIQNTQGATSVSYSSTDTTNDPNAGGNAPLKFTLIRNKDNGYAFQISSYNSKDGGYVTILDTERLSADGTNYSVTNAENSNSWYYLNPDQGGTEQSGTLINSLMYHLTQQWNQTPDSTTLASIPGVLSSTLSDPDLADLMYFPAINSDTTNNTAYSIANFGALKTAWSVASQTLPTTSQSNTLTSIINPTQVYFTGPATTAYEDIMHGGAPSYPKPDSTHTDLKDAMQRASDYRSQANALLQTYVQSASSEKDMASDAGKRVETAMTQIKESLQNQNDLCTSITDTLRDLLSAIFK